ncbi:MAG: type I glyceraldehyde-3-phosphate dehydrogenase [Proteobacteria bacterium]|nr:type I glyceraldehyde-3-phosphate dehydrogenase [Pseudomonadota bacterium]
MAIRVAINGFGRIGRMVLRALYERNEQEIEIVAINDLCPIEDNIHLLKYDSVHGRFLTSIEQENDYMIINSDRIKMLSEKDPKNLPWEEFDIDIVFECSGRFTKREAAHDHVIAGAKHVLISAPGDGVDLTVVYGVNHTLLNKTHKIISNASCTTNCLAPIADVLHKTVGIDVGYMTTIHAYTGDQRLVDTAHSDLRRARAACESMIPSSTGAAKAVGLVLPALKGKLDGTAIRVPTSNVSVIDLTFVAQKMATPEIINNAMKEASKGYLKGVLDVVDEPLVSKDFNHQSYSSIFDLTQTQVIDNRFCRVLSWYDNEWGFSNRMLDVAKYWFPND